MLIRYSIYVTRFRRVVNECLPYLHRSLSNDHNTILTNKIECSENFVTTFGTQHLKEGTTRRLCSGCLGRYVFFVKFGGFARDTGDLE